MAKSNVAVYYGQTPVTSQVSFTTLCNDDSVDIIVIAFLTAFTSGYPTLNVGPECGSASSAQTAAGATGLLDCSSLGKEVATCQAKGKKVMLSLGGATGDNIFSSADEATSAAEMVWDLFGAGTGQNADLRPFGETVYLDGFDIGKFSIFHLHRTFNLTHATRQRRQQPVLLCNLHLPPPLPLPNQQLRLRLQALLPQRRTAMPHPRCLHPAIQHANLPRLHLHPILQQPRLQRRHNRLLLLRRILVRAPHAQHYVLRDTNQQRLQRHRQWSHGWPETVRRKSILERWWQRVRCGQQFELCGRECDDVGEFRRN